MNPNPIHVVTGAFSYTGKYITRRLLDSGNHVKTLTNHPNRENPFDKPIETCPYDFDHPEKLTRSLQGATVLYNTYWVRFAYGKTSFEQAIQNSKILFDSAKQAGIQRIVHVSIANPSEESPLAYYKGKAQVENHLKQCGVSYAILRPTLIFGKEDILINNIAWHLRKFPVFGIPGSGDYGIQPIHVEDMADIAVKAGESRENIILDAAGPEIFSFYELVNLIKTKIQSHTKIIHVSPALALVLTRMIGFFVKDVILTKEEIDGLMANLLVSKNPPTGSRKVSDWLEENKNTVGFKYASEVARHF